MAGGEWLIARSTWTRLSRHGVPWVGLVIAYVVGLIFFFPFPSWQGLVSAVSLITVLSYGIGPVLILALRKSLPDEKRPFRLRAVRLISTLAFIVANWIIYWTGYHTIIWLFSFVAFYIVCYMLWTVVGFLRGRYPSALPGGWQHAWWIAPYFGGMWAIAYCGPGGRMGGQGFYGFFVGMGIIAGFSLAILALAVATRQSDEDARKDNAFVQTLGTRGVVGPEEEQLVRGAEETAP